MLPDFFNEDGEFDWSTWTVYIAAAAGILSTATVLLIGWLVSRRREDGDNYEAALPAPTKAGSNPGADPFAQGANRGERRAANRRGGNPIAILVSDADARAQPTNGWVVDRSTGGLCLTVAQSMSEGTVLSVRTTNAPATVPWVQLEVKSCRNVGKEFELGCKFTKTPPWSVMLLFG